MTTLDIKNIPFRYVFKYEDEEEFDLYVFDYLSYLVGVQYRFERSTKRLPPQTLSDIWDQYHSVAIITVSDGINAIYTYHMVRDELDESIKTIEDEVLRIVSILNERDTKRLLEKL